MFFPGSRYLSVGTYSLVQPDGTLLKVTRIPLPGSAVTIGYFRRGAGQRLDLIANHFLIDATAFWRLCDANNAVVPDALGQRDLIGVPPGASG